MEKVYFIQAQCKKDEDGPIKIGHTKGAPQDRLKQLQTGNHCSLKIIGVGEGTTADEARLHRQFKDQRGLGEWFEPNPALHEIIKYVNDGLPISRAIVTATIIQLAEQALRNFK